MVGTLPFSTVQDILQQWALNRIAYHAAHQLAKGHGAAPVCAIHADVDARPAGRVFDWVPLVHMWKRLLPSKRRRAKPKKDALNGSLCMRGTGNINSTIHTAQNVAHERSVRNGSAFGHAMLRCPWAWWHVGGKAAWGRQRRFGEPYVNATVTATM